MLRSELLGQKPNSVPLWKFSGAPNPQTDGPRFPEFPDSARYRVTLLVGIGFGTLEGNPPLLDGFRWVGSS